MWLVPINPHVGTGGDRLPEEVPEDQPPGDARAWFEANGIPFAEGEEAFFDGRLRVLMVRAQAATIERVDKIVHQHWPHLPVENLRVEFTLVEFSAAKTPGLKGDTAYAALLKEAGDSWHVLNQLQVVARSGWRASAISRFGDSLEQPDTAGSKKNLSPLDDPSVSLQPGEFGATAEIEPTLSFDEKDIDMNFAYRFRAPGNPPWGWKISTTLTIKDGRPLIAQIDSAPPGADHSSAGKSRALVVRVDVVRSEKGHASEAKAPAMPPFK